MPSHDNLSGTGAAVAAGSVQKTLHMLTETSDAPHWVPVLPAGVQGSALTSDSEPFAAMLRMPAFSSVAATAQALSSGLAAQVGLHFDGAVARLAATMPRIAVAEQLVASFAAAAPMAAMPDVLAQSASAQRALDDAWAPTIARQQALIGQVMRSSGVTALGLHPKAAVLPGRRIGQESAFLYPVPVCPAPDPLRFRARVRDRAGRDLLSALERAGLGDVADLLVGGWENLERRTPGAVSFAAHAAVEVIDRTLKRVAPEQQVRQWLIESGRMPADRPRWTTVAERLEFTALRLDVRLAEELTDIERALVRARTRAQSGKHASEGALASVSRLLQLAESFVEVVVVDGRAGAHEA